MVERKLPNGMIETYVVESAGSEKECTLFQITIR